MKERTAPFLTLAGAAAVVDKDAAVITRAVASGTLPHFVTECGKAKLLRKSDVLKWAARTSWENRKRIASKQD